jgi:CheY-like chemotaxis protein
VAKAARKHILVINNDATVLEVVRELLEDEGYQVSLRAYANKDLAEIVAIEPDLIVLDYMWASDDGGWSLLQVLRVDPRTSTIPIVLCTGAAVEVEALSARLTEMGVRVVLKPFDIDQLTNAIAEGLKRPPQRPTESKKVEATE